MSTSRQFRLAARPVGELKASDWELVEAPVPRPGDGEFVVEATHISLDPATRRWMSAGRPYIPPVEIGEVMRAFTLGRVLDSRHPDFAEGDLVHGTFGVQEHAVSDGAGVHKIDSDDGVSLAAHLGVLGLTGMTAYFGLLDVGRLRAGDTAVGGRNVEVVHVDDEEFASVFADAEGLPIAVGRLMASFGRATREGQLDVLSDDFAKLVGRAPRDLETVLSAPAQSVA